MKKQILTNVASNYLLSFFGMGLGFLLVPFLIKHLGKEAYGITVLAESTVIFFEILTVSVRIALSRYATVSLSRNEPDNFIEYLSTGRVILHFSAAIVLFLGFIVSINFTNIFQVPESLALDSQALFLLMSFAVTMSIPKIIYWSVLYAKQRFDLINFSRSFGLIMRAVCIYIYYLYAPQTYQTLTAYGVIYLIMTLTENYMVYYWHMRVMPAGLRISFRYFKINRVREILSFSVHTSLSRVSGLLYQQTAQIIINIFWGPAYNAIYSVAMKIPSMMSRLFVEPSWVLSATFTDLEARGKKDSVTFILFMYSKALSVVTFPLCFLMILFSRPLIVSWVGTDFEMAGRLLPYFCVPLFTSIPFSLAGNILNAHGKVKIPSFVSFGSAVCNVVLCLVLGQMFGFKLYGVALAALFSSTLYATIFMPIYSCRVGGISIRRYWVESLIKPLILSCLFMVGGFVGLGLTRYITVLDLGLCATVTGLLISYYLSAYLVLLNAEEKGYVRRILRFGEDGVSRLGRLTR